MFSELISDPLKKSEELERKRSGKGEENVLAWVFLVLGSLILSFCRQNKKLGAALEYSLFSFSVFVFLFSQERKKFLQS